MRRRLAAVGVLAGSMCMLLPAVVSAHVYEVDLDCGGLFVYMNAYSSEQGSSNTLKIFIDDKLEVERSFDTGFEETFDVGDPTRAHDVRVEVRAFDDDNGPDADNNGEPSWSFDWADTIGACQEPTPAPTPREAHFTTLVRTPICNGDVPYLHYEVDVAGTDANVVKITFVNPNGEDFVYQNLPFKGRVLWPGAEVDSKGNPVDWPGWRLVNGEWVEGDQWDWTRPSVQVRFTVNPTRTVRVAYPPATPKCSANPPNVPEPTLPPNLDLPPTDTAGDYGMTSGDSQGAGQGILFLLAVMAAAGSTYGIRTVRRRAAAKR